MKARMISANVLELTFEAIIYHIEGTITYTRQIELRSTIRNHIVLKAEVNPNNFYNGFEHTLFISYDAEPFSTNYEKITISKDEYEEIDEFVNHYPLSLCPPIARIITNAIMELEI